MGKQPSRLRGLRLDLAGVGAALAALAALALVATLAIGHARAEGADPGSAPPLARAPDGRPLALTFSHDFHEFDADLRDGRVWRTTFGNGSADGVDQRSLPSNGELQLYVDPRYGAQIGDPGLNPFHVGDEGLDIVAQPASPALASKLAGRRYVSGLISSQPSFSQLYGYFEVRARLPQGKGLWPALWLLPADLSWPPEIDMVESIGDPLTIYASTHSGAEPTYTKQVRLADGGFHTFAVSWDAQNVVWYVDGAEVARHPTPADMHKPMFFLANLAVGGTWPGAPDASTHFPAKLTLKYVRAYRFA